LFFGLTEFGLVGTTGDCSVIFFHDIGGAGFQSATLLHGYAALANRQMFFFIIGLLGVQIMDKFSMDLYDYCDSLGPLYRSMKPPEPLAPHLSKFGTSDVPSYCMDLQSREGLDGSIHGPQNID
jgi:hypothetical protein